MKWVKTDNTKIPIKSWCENVEHGAMLQAINLANHPVIVKHVALMPDCHQGYGMPIGGVIACENAVIPNAVGVDIGCGMGAIQTNYSVTELKDKKLLRDILDFIKYHIPLGEGNSHKKSQSWTGFTEFIKKFDLIEKELSFPNKKLPGWLDQKGYSLDQRNLGSLGGGNHFIEIQSGDDGFVWLMLHSGSRNLGYRVAAFYNRKALELNIKWKTELPDKNLAFLPADSLEGQAYIRDMNYALTYAKENRKRMMDIFKDSIVNYLKDIRFVQEINIHHNYAAVENHFGTNFWIHRKGATSAKKGELGIIPGSMGTPSYIVEGLGNPESFMSCSHGAGRNMGRNDANKKLKIEDCNKAMEGIVYDWWKKTKSRRGKQKMLDLSEAPLAYKDIEEVIEAQLDLIKPLVKLKPLGVVKG